jgi:hypothetical protein
MCKQILCSQQRRYDGCSVTAGPPVVRAATVCVALGTSSVHPVRKGTAVPTSTFRFVSILMLFHAEVVSHRNDRAVINFASCVK